MHSTTFNFRYPVVEKADTCFDIMRPALGLFVRMETSAFFKWFTDWWLTGMDVFLLPHHRVVRSSKAICAWKLVVTVNWETAWQVTVCSTEMCTGTTWLCPERSACKIWWLVSRCAQLTKNVLMLKTTECKSLRWCFWHIITSVSGFNQLRTCLSSPQSTRDIESRMRSETRLKLFTLDPDTQVKHI